MAQNMSNREKWANLGQQQPQAYRRASGEPSRSQAQHAPRQYPDQPPRQPQGPASLADFIRDNSTYIISVAAVVAVVALMLVFLRACAPEDPTTESTDEPYAYASPFNWENLDRTNGRYAYVVGGAVKSRLGVDVSENQFDIDWNSVAADGVDFAMIRLGYRGATEGDLYLDEYYWANLIGARDAGLDCGVYFFSQAVNEQEAVEEAEFVLEYLNGTQLQYPVAFDSEVVAGLGITRTQDLSSEQMDSIANAFCDRIRAAGYRTMIYGNAIDLTQYDLESLTAHDIWWAEYDAAQPAHYVDIALWQYTNGGDVAGISTAVDLNIDLSAAL